MNNTIDTLDYKGYTIKIELDNIPINPREWDNLAEFIFLHRRYNLGDRPDIKTFDQLNDRLQKDDVITAYWVYMYDHSSLAFSLTSFNDPWDSGKIGVAVITKQAVKMMGTSPEHYLDCVQSELKVYQDYLNGDVYGYIIEDENGDEVDSCWGFYGDDTLAEAKSVVDYLVNKELETNWIEFSESEEYYE